MAVARKSAPTRIIKTDTVSLFRVILPVSDIDSAARFYSIIFDRPGERVSPGRHYFNFAGAVLALYDPRADGDSCDPRPNQEPVYLAVSGLKSYLKRARLTGYVPLDIEIEERPWGETSFYITDPSGNQVCFVDKRTVFTGQRRSK
ncbi:MAG: VOC family protein [candidate division Zixibacteria bacterium]|nr:VOC family protein [candidate division Zixibacteria bacterium]